ncbi:uncharacterized protein RHOBADRAFT_50546 [Rhodotorula graminis WP1]|uniref:Uncharacterized protein n=1 Tax=Rhodotorula graminis (strain WP1) TaxID=578459 RepID=A0A194SBR0_RHOGW|nr:uncharacterized protein RHOBADRAFT_50546 [Rhodotorula graminis WP1]KPV78024.1 hypothetical protein RHOBADRAFT_50546 [Rhodotorula graminis WP1]
MSLVQSTIDDYLVASFPLPTPAQARALPPHPPVAAVQYTAHPRQDARLAVATPGVGLSVYDLADQTPLSSITVGPSFAPTTAAISRSTPSTSSDSIRVKSARRTWVGVRTDEGKGEIWCWHEEERKDGSTEGDSGKAVWPISEPLAALAAPRTLPSHISFLSTSGALALAPADDLTSLASLPAPTDASPAVSQTLRLVHVSATSAPAFLPSSLVAALPTSSSSKAHLGLIVRKYAAPTPADGGSLVDVGKKKFKKAPRPSSSAVIDAADAAGPSTAQVGQRSEIELVLMDPEVAMPDEFEPRLGLLSLGKVAVEGEQVVVSDDGIVTALGSNGTLAASRLSFTSPLPVDTYSTLYFPPAPVDTPTLALAPLKSVALSTSSLTPSLSCLLALHSSFVVVASPRPTTSDSSAPTVSLTYWDTRFGSVIASADLTVPSAVASSVSALSLSLSLPARHTAILTLSPAPSASGTRTALFGLPVASLPSASVLAAVVGKHSLTARFLAVSPAAQSVVARAKATEPLRSQRPGQSEKKLALQEASRLAREHLLERLERVLAPLKAGAGAIAQDVAVVEAEKVWAKWLDEDKDRLWDYNKGKVRAAMEKEQERRMAAITDAGEDADGDASRYKVAKRKIERAIAAAGASVKPGVVGAATTADKKAAKASWKDVTAARIKGVSDRYRYMYHRERNKMEEAMGKTVKEFDWDEAVAKVERYEPSLPSSFVTALLRLSFPVPLTSSTDLTISPSGVLAASETVWRHPTKIIGYLLRRELVGENQVEGGVTSFLARAADWPNIMLALKTLPDIPESTTVALLVAVVRGTSSRASADDAMDTEDASTALPAPVPALAPFLAAMLASPCTPATLRLELKKQLSAAEALPVLEQCDAWFAAWLRDAQPEAPRDDVKAKKGKGNKAVAADIVPFVQAILDAHFVTLLLQRQSHRLLRRLSQHIATHTALVTDLSTLIGALSIYSRKKDEQRRAALEDKAAAGRKAQRDGVREFGETMQRRIKAQEKHAEVGQYQVEEFFL